ncbi:Beta-catenin-interacting protein 1 [Anabarilius grahami]|uniref:Beta-catenin-interacting protein 1 n=1 Tax=Anabarilius grahami TaxID=495550 RepID=A0A3N0YMK6_ANAGA|nr:Beta-catenin-interacting protein 1 [Anabarilius grahami]
MNREEAPGKSPEEMYIQQKVRVLLMLKKMGSNLTPNEEAFLRNYAGVVHSQMSQLPQHPIDQGLSLTDPHHWLKADNEAVREPTAPFMDALGTELQSEYSRQFPWRWNEC